MQLYILDSEYYNLGVVDESESVLWNKKYNDVGECEIYIPCNTEYLNLLRRGNYIYRYEDDMFCKIESLKLETNIEDGNYIVATAKDICSILAGRIVRWQIVFSGTLGQFIFKILTDNVINPEQSKRAIPNFEFDASNIDEFSEKIETSTFTDDLLQLLLTTCKTNNIGFRISFDIETRKLIFRLYKGKNKASLTGNEYVEFSPDYSNILNSNYTEDDSNYKNVAYVGYKGEDEETHLLSLFKGSEEPSGEARREVYVDATSTSKEITGEQLQEMFSSVSKSGNSYYATINGEQILVATSEGSGEEEKITVTDYTYLLLIRVIGENALAEQVSTQSFEGNVDTLDSYEYKVDYDLGDIVKVKNEYGIEAEARITEIMESDDADNGYSIEPKFEFLN